MLKLSNTPPREKRSGDTVILFAGHNPVVRTENESVHFPTVGEVASLSPEVELETCIGVIGGVPVFSASVDEEKLPWTWEAVSLRSLFGRMDDDMIAAAVTALHLLQWTQNSRYCGRCGAATREKTDERAKLCPSCGLVIFPRISPAIIVAVQKAGRILLVRNKRHPNAMYSLVAGFVEAGETLEQTVAREIMEETGIAVGQIRYWGSQPWPFPDSLMMGFTAEYAAGSIRVDGNEIIGANWFSADSMPTIPPPGSISRKIMDWFVRTSSERS